MRLQSLSLTLIPSLCSAIAVPATPAGDDVINATASFCTERNFKGYCKTITSPWAVCVELGPDLNDTVSSLSPAPGSFCYFYVDPGCRFQNRFFHVSHPGVSDLSVTPVNGPPGTTRNFEDALSSYRCVQ